jgi:hypothetical protein
MNYSHPTKMMTKPATASRLSRPILSQSAFILGAIASIGVGASHPAHGQNLVANHKFDIPCSGPTKLATDASGGTGPSSGVP